jgi:ribosomal protein S18 acetylase RimI-like enzyme
VSGALRVDLRAPRPDDSRFVDVWLTEAMAAITGGAAGAAPPLRWDGFRRDLGRGRKPLLITRDEVPVGLAIVRLPAGGQVRLEALAIEATQRNLGLGTEAVLLLEAQFGGPALVAGVPVTNGLAIYFWLRAGYRPLYPRGRGERLSPDRIWMQRPVPVARTSAALRGGLQ